MERYANIKVDRINYTSTNDQRKCKHSNGWFISVSFWIFTKRKFVCTDCGACLDSAKHLKG